MDKTWIRTITFALALAGCSHASDSPDETDDKGDEEKTIEGDAGKEHAPTGGKKDSSAPIVDRADPGDPDASPAKRDAELEADASNDQGADAADPVCAPKPGPGGFDPSMPPPGFVPDNIVSMADGTIFTTGGGVYKVPGHGPVFGRMENGACIVTVAETGVSTTVIGDGDVCINGHLVATGGKCAVDESGNKIEP